MSKRGFKKHEHVIDAYKATHTFTGMWAYLLLYDYSGRTPNFDFCLMSRLYESRKCKLKQISMLLWSAEGVLQIHTVLLGKYWGVRVLLFQPLAEFKANCQRLRWPSMTMKLNLKSTLTKIETLTMVGWEIQILRVATWYYFKCTISIKLLTILRK